MAIFNLSHFGLGKRALLAGLALGLLAFLVFIEFIATTQQLKFIGANNLDKIAHLSGGMFIALLLEAAGRPVRVMRLFTIIGTAAVGWEGYEFFFDADTAYFYRYFPDLWRLDAAGDIAAALLGGYGYWVFGRLRR